MTWHQNVDQMSTDEVIDTRFASARMRREWNAIRMPSGTCRSTRRSTQSYEAADCCMGVSVATPGGAWWGATVVAVTAATAAAAAAATAAATAGARTTIEAATGTAAAAAVVAGVETATADEL